MPRGLDLKEQLSFRVTYAKLWYGNGPFDSQVRARADDDADVNEGRPILYLEMKGGHYKFSRLLGKRPATALLHRHPTGEEHTGTGVSARGQLDIGEIEEEDEGARTYVEIFGFLPEASFDAVASALIAGGRDLLSRCRLHVGLQEDRDAIDCDKREGSLGDATFLLDDLAITFEIGDKYDELSED